MIIRCLTSTLFTILFIMTSCQLMAQVDGCGTCLTARPDSLVTSATLHLSWEQSGMVRTNSFPWQPGDTVEVTCWDGSTPLFDLSYAMTSTGDTLGVIWGDRAETPTYNRINQPTDNPALFRILDTVPGEDCTAQIIRYQFDPPDEGFQCNAVIPGTELTISKRLDFPVGSGRMIVDFQAFKVIDTLIIYEGGVVKFREAIGTYDGATLDQNIIWHNGITRDFEDESPLVPGYSFIRVILDIEDNCDLSVEVLSNQDTNTGWQLYVHCCPECYNPPLKTLTIDTTVCETGTFFGQVVTEDGEVSELTQTQRGCDSLTTYNVHVAKPRIQSIKVTDALCFGSADGQALAFVNAETPLLAWSTGATSPGIKGLAAGDYALTVTDWYGCTSSESFTVGEPTKLEASFDEQWPSCYGFQDGTLRLTPAGGTPGYSVSWRDGSDEMQKERLFSGHYSPTLTDAHGCTLESAYFLDQPDTLTVDLTVELATCRGIPDGTAEAVTVGGTYPYSWNWHDVGEEEGVRYDLLNGPYFVKATDVNGCIDSARYVLHYEKEDLSYVPNSFSPNGDGKNDYFAPMGGACIREVNYFAIFDRWGALLYEKRAFQPGDPLAGWDGTHKGDILNPGLYVWTLVVTYHSGYVEEKGGGVTLNR